MWSILVNAFSYALKNNVNPIILECSVLYMPVRSKYTNCVDYIFFNIFIVDSVTDAPPFTPYCPVPPGSHPTPGLYYPIVYVHG